jgi:hypothetical protein
VDDFPSFDWFLLLGRLATACEHHLPVELDDIAKAWSVGVRAQAANAIASLILDGSSPSERPGPKSGVVCRNLVPRHGEAQQALRQR